jgi:hypothetical protein
VVPPTVLAALPSYGQAVIDARRGGRPVTDPRFDWTTFVGPVHRALGSDDRGQVIAELYAAATTSPERELATLGAYRLMAESDDGLDDLRYLELCDDALEHLRALGFASGHLTGSEARRWIETHGDLRTSFDAIVDVDVPAPDEAPVPAPLAPGEARMVALMAALPDGNALFAEHRAGAGYVVVVEAPWSVEDPRRSRTDLQDLGVFGSLPDLLRALGARLGIPPHWADEDLKPYFPLRQRR